MARTAVPTKVYQGVAKCSDMFRMFDRHRNRPNRFDDDQSAVYAGEWFEIEKGSYEYMLDVLPPLWIRGSIFAMREFMAGWVTSVFIAVRIADARRYFHTYCDLSDPVSVERMHAEILARENRQGCAMSREERLEHIWSTAADDHRGYAGERWPKPLRGHRTVVLFDGKEGRFLKLLDSLTDDEIAAKLPVHLRHLPLTLAA